MSQVLTITDDNPVHYDIRAVSGYARAACGYDNTVGINEPWTCTNNRNNVSCKACLEKIEILAEHGGYAIASPTQGPDEADKAWFKDLVREVFDEEDEEYDSEFAREDQKSIFKEAAYELNAQYAEFYAEQQKARAKEALREVITEFRQDQDIYAEDKSVVKEAVNEVLKEGGLKFDTVQLEEVVRAQMHRVLNGRDGEVALTVEKVLNAKMAEAACLVATDFMTSESVKNMLFRMSRDGTEVALEENEEELTALIKKGVDEALNERGEVGKPVQFVQNVYTEAEGSVMSASEVYQATQEALLALNKPVTHYCRSVDEGNFCGFESGAGDKRTPFTGVRHVTCKRCRSKLAQTLTVRDDIQYTLDKIETAIVTKQITTKQLVTFLDIVGGA